jgi:short-subunit dehydrogenase
MSGARKAVLITGGSDGIGAATVRKFHAEGWAVAHVSDRRPPSPLPEGIVEVYGDIADPAVRQQAVDSTLKAYGRIDALINNAATGLYALPLETSLEHTRRVFEVNVFAIIALTQLIVPIMKKQGGGTIVDIGSIVGSVSMHWAAIYCASKFALHGWHESLYRELRGSSIKVVKVCPSVTRTNFRQYVLTGKAPDNVLKLKIVVSPDYIAKCVYKGTVRGSRTVYAPLYGLPFVLVEKLCPWLMDIYLAHKAR